MCVCFFFRQELAAISLDVSRNSMIAVDIRLAMLNLGVASSACVFGAMGETLRAPYVADLGGAGTMPPSLGREKRMRGVRLTK